MRVEKLNKSYRLFSDNGKEIGSFQLDVNGYYYFYTDEETSGGWESYSLREIADELYRINKPYEDSIEEYFRKESEKIQNCEHDFQVMKDFLQIESYVCSKCGLEQEIPKLKINDLSVDL